MQNLRLRFTKKNNTVFISHLDLSRLFSRAFKRAGIPLWYTEGFNPHANIVFSPPLSVGYESECEIADIKLTDECPDIIEKLNSCLPDGIKITDAYTPVNKISDIEFSEYEIILLNENYGRIYELLFNEAELNVEKKSKTKIQTINIKDYLLKCDIEKIDANVKINVLLPSGNAFTVNPSLLPKALNASDAKYTRTNLLTGEKKALA